MISVGYNVVFTETKKIFKKYLTLDARRDIVLQNVKTKQSSTLHLSARKMRLGFICTHGFSVYQWV